MARPPTFAHDRNQRQQQQQHHQRQHIGICEPPLGLVKDKNHPSEQTDQLDLSHSLVLLPEPLSPSPATLSTYAKMGPSTVAHFMSISLGSMYNACFANFYELANGQEEFKVIMAETLVVPARYSPPGNAYFLMSRRWQNIFQWPH